MNSDVLVSIGLPIRNGEKSVEGVAQSVLAQDHENLELVICDNASTDGTEETCRELAASDKRIRYHRRSANIGLVPNFLGALAMAEGTWFRWIGDGDRIDATCVSRCLEVAAEDDRLILVSTHMGYELADGRVVNGEYRGMALRSTDPTVRFAEMLHLLTSGFAELDPLYGLLRRERVDGVRFRRILRGDEVYAARLALAGPWGHVPEVLARRGWEQASPAQIAPRLGLPRWQAAAASELQCLELLRAVDEAELSADQRRMARSAVARLYRTRMRNAVARVGRRVRPRREENVNPVAGRSDVPHVAPTLGR